MIEVDLNGMNNNLHKVQNVEKNIRIFKNIGMFSIKYNRKKSRNLEETL